MNKLAPSWQMGHPTAPHIPSAYAISLSLSLSLCFRTTWLGLANIEPKHQPPYGPYLSREFLILTKRKQYPISQFPRFLTLLYPKKANTVCSVSHAHKEHSQTKQAFRWRSGTFHGLVGIRICEVCVVGKSQYNYIN
jgi:hypothetical protein